MVTKRSVTLAGNSSSTTRPAAATMAVDCHRTCSALSSISAITASATIAPREYVAASVAVTIAAARPDSLRCQRSRAWKARITAGGMAMRSMRAKKFGSPFGPAMRGWKTSP